MNRIKKIIIFLIVILCIAGAASGGIYAYQKYQKENLQAEVVYVSSLNWGWGGDSMSSSGYVSDNYTQLIYTEDKTIKEVKVEEGEEVSIGDPLLVYDTSEIQIQIEMKKLELQGIKNDITLANRELERLKKITPTASTASTGSSSTGSAGTTANRTTTGSTTTGSTTTGGTTTGSTTTTKQEPSIVMMQVQKKDGDAYNYIDTTAKPYQGSGTAGDPYRFLCTQQCYVLGEYLNQLIDNEETAAFEIWSGNSVTEGTLITCWTVNGAEKSKVDADSKWLVATQEKLDNGVEIEDTETETQENTSETKESESSESESGTTEDTTEEIYTAEELKKEISEKESEIKELTIDRKSVNLELTSLRKSKKAATVVSNIDGVVRTVGDPENPPADGSAFMEIAGSEGMYVKGEISELMLDQIEIGQEISANSWSNGQMYAAVITEISEYPSESSGNYYGEGNSNVSYYSFMAYIEDSTGLTNGDYLDISITPMGTEENMDSLYIEKAYVRDENGKSYVLKVGEDGCLVKQYVQTGKILYGSAIEIKSGLSEADRIAFPYGKTAKEGIKAVDSENM